jgi:hypothetical protein
MTTSTTGKENLPLSAHPKKLIRFAEIYAKGIYTASQAAREVGYAESVARARCHQWIGRTRQESEYPVLWDYYEKLRKENIREFDLNAEAIGNELRLIAFSDITRFMDLPRKEYELKALLAQETERAIICVNEYPALMRDYAEDLSAYDRAVELQDQQKGGRKKKLTRPTEPERPTERQNDLYEKFRLMSDEQRLELMVWKTYRAGSLRLKNAEEIPAALFPVIAELAETRDGIKLKLHDKISALDKLARWKKMYDDKPEAGEGVVQVKEINITVNGSKSTLKINQEEPTSKEEKAA